MVAAGVPGDAEAAGHSATAGTGEGATDASGAAETHHSDESTDARLLFALRSGVTAIHVCHILPEIGTRTFIRVCSLIVDAVSAS